MNFRRLKLLLSVIILLLAGRAQPAGAFWIWTPETNKWVNPKYAVKDTPSEQLQFGIEYYNQKEYKEAIREFNKLIRHYPKARETPEAQYYIGLCWEEQGELFEAYKQYQVVIEKYPFSERAPEIVKKEFDIGVAFLDGKVKKKFMNLSDDYDVVQIFRTVIKNAPYGELAPLSYYKIGLYLQEKKMFQEARDEFEKLTNDYPDSEWAKAAKFQVAMTDYHRSTDAQYDQRVTKVAVEEFKDFVNSNPDAELSAKAKEQISKLREKEAENNFIIAEFYEKQKNYTAAKIYYQDIVNDYRGSPWAVKALSKIQELAPKIQ